MPVFVAAKKMIEHKMRRLPVTNADGKLTGMGTVRATTDLKQPDEYYEKHSKKTEGEPVDFEC